MRFVSRGRRYRLVATPFQEKKGAAVRIHEADEPRHSLTCGQEVASPIQLRIGSAQC